MQTEFVKFQLIQMPCCGQLLCWVNPRLPNFCPECGKGPFHFKIQHGDKILFSDDSARLIHRDIPRSETA